MNKANRRHWKLFKKEFEYWGNVFGFNRFDIQHEFCDEDMKACSCVIVQDEPTNFIVLFCKHWYDTPVSSEEVAKVAFHEAMEILLSPIENSVDKKQTQRAREEVHIIINIMTKLLFKPYWSKRK